MVLKFYNMTWYSIINHEQRLALGLSNDEYVLAEYICRTNNPNFWDEKPKQLIEESLGFNKEQSAVLYNSLLKKGLIEIDEIFNFIPTEKLFNAIVLQQSIIF